MALDPNDRLVLHRLLLARARSVVSLSDLLRGDVPSDSDYEAFTASLEHSKAALQLLKEVLIDGYSQKAQLQIF